MDDWSDAWPGRAERAKSVVPWIAEESISPAPVGRASHFFFAAEVCVALCGGGEVVSARIGERWTRLRGVHRRCVDGVAVDAEREIAACELIVANGRCGGIERDGEGGEVTVPLVLDGELGWLRALATGEKRGGEERGGEREEPVPGGERGAAERQLWSGACEHLCMKHAPGMSKSTG